MFDCVTLENMSISHPSLNTPDFRAYTHDSGFQTVFEGIVWTSRIPVDTVITLPYGLSFPEVIYWA
jgi:hypothetical protein